MTDAQFIALNAKLDLILARLDQVLSHPQAAAPTSAPSVSSKVSGALALASIGLPREARLNMRTVALAKIAQGLAEDDVIRAIENGESSQHPMAREISASV